MADNQQNTLKSLGLSIKHQKTRRLSLFLISITILCSVCTTSFIVWKNNRSQKRLDQYYFNKFESVFYPTHNLMPLAESKEEIIQLLQSCADRLEKVKVDMVKDGYKTIEIEDIEVKAREHSLERCDDHLSADEMAKRLWK